MSRIKTKITDCHNGPQNKHREPCKMANRTEGQFLVLSGPHTKLPWPSQWPSKDSQALYTPLAPLSGPQHPELVWPSVWPSSLALLARIVALTVALRCGPYSGPLSGPQ